MKYLINKESLIGILREIDTNNSGLFFKEDDKFDPAWSGLLKLISFNHTGFGHGKVFKNVRDALSFRQYFEFNGNVDDKIKYNNRNPKHSYIQIWVPFLDDDITLQKSMDNWCDINNLTIDERLLDESLKNNPNFSEWLVDANNKIRELLENIFLIFGELYANSVTHGITSKNDKASDSNMTGFIVANKDGSWDFFHADLGNTIVKNILSVAPEKVMGLSHGEIMKWSSIFGNSSKQKEKFRVSGGGMSILKIFTLYGGGEICCISGEYKMEFKPKNTILSLEEIEGANIDNLVEVNVEKLDFHYPGTSWLAHIVEPSKISTDLMKEIDKLREENKEEIDDFLKGYII